MSGQPRRETVRDLLARAPQAARPAAPSRPPLGHRVGDVAGRQAADERRRLAAEEAAGARESGGEESEAELVIALRARLERAAREIVAEPRFAPFRRGESGYVWAKDGSARGIGARIELWRED